jgi:glycosyltransferase involved in cell wall biosynthesis
MEPIKAKATEELIFNPPQQVGYLVPGQTAHNAVFPSITQDKRDAPNFRNIIAVIPAYNEELAIGTVVLITKRHVSHTIVVDDGSDDQTAEVAQSAGAEVIRLLVNSGKAHAMMAGFKRALSYQPAAVVMLDGDGQHNPEEIPKMVAPILEKDIDLVIGSRFLSVTNKIPGYRQLGQKILDFVTNVSYGENGKENNKKTGGGDGNLIKGEGAVQYGDRNRGVTTDSISPSNQNYRTSDSQSGYRALSLNALNNIDFYSEDYNLESDMLAHFIDRGLKISEVPITVKYDVANSHKKNPISHGMDVLGHIIGMIGYKRPLLTFGIPGIIVVTVGLIVASYAFGGYYQTARFSFLATMVSGICLVLGMLLISIALTLNSLVQIVRMERARS